MRIAIIDDEAPARRRLIRLIEQHSLGTVVAEAATVQQALSTLHTTALDAALLDVQLPDGTGFDILRHLAHPPPFAPIICTAYSEYAVDAFNAAATDYLLKPVQPERLRAALDRNRTQPLPHAERLLAERHKSLHIIETHSIDWIEADRNYIVLHIAREEFILRATLESMERRLDPSRFVRIHRGAILRWDAIRNVSSTADGSLVITLKSDETLACPRRQAATFLKRLRSVFP
jgi:two-component system LytT family response regulator